MIFNLYRVDRRVQSERAMFCKSQMSVIRDFSGLTFFCSCHHQGKEVLSEKEREREGESEDDAFCAYACIHSLPRRTHMQAVWKQRNLLANFSQLRPSEKSERRHGGMKC